MELALWLDGANGDFSGGDYYGIIANNNAQLQLGYTGDSDFVLDSAGNITIGKGGTSLHFQNGFNNMQLLVYKMVGEVIIQS